MKLALITDPRGFPIVKQLRLSYHLVLAQYVRQDYKYSDFYVEARSQGDFIMLDNGAAEDLSLQLHELQSAAEIVKPDEIILPDVLADRAETLKRSFDQKVLAWVPPIKRAVVPQGINQVEWLVCASEFMVNLKFATMCVPKHCERFVGGRIALLEEIYHRKWHERFNIHLLGVWGSPFSEVRALAKAAPWVRGIDTAAPFAFAQAGHKIDDNEVSHVSHVWGRKFDRTLAANNSAAVQLAAWGY